MSRTRTGDPNKRDALIDAAKALLVERGYEAMSPKAILKQSGAGQGSLYHHFEGKRDLAAAALHSILDDARAELALRLNPRLSPLKRIEAYLDTPREALKGCRLGRLANEQTIFDPVLGPIVQAYFQELETFIIQALKEARTSGLLPSSLRPNDVARLLIATVQGGYVLSRVHQDPTQMHDAIQGAKAVLRALSSSHNVPN